MSASSGTRFTRGLGPLLNGYSDQHVRVSDAERQDVADRLATHYAEGRLDQAEFDERCGRAMSAKTRGDLVGLLDDLPEPRPAGAPARGRRHRRDHPLLLVVALIIVASVAWHAVFWFAGWLWIAAIALIALAATGHLGHRRSRTE
jgi:Domain of unknown function (DUF1707)